ncbi:MAG TPA: hypothetical protein VGF94_14460 [Kofleriaceae bacterium]|jgi:hypothetical protein
MRRPPLAVAAAAAVLAGGCWYPANSFENGNTPFPGKRVQLVCLDASVTLVQDARASGYVLAYSFGNRCSHATIVDLPAVRVIGRDAGGANSPLRPYDPDDELRALPIDGGWRGYEEIEYSSREAPAWRDVCADLGHLELRPDPVDDWICLAMSDEGATP